MKSVNKSILPAYKGCLSEPILPRIVFMPKNSIYPNHLHDYGEFNFCYRGVLNIQINEKHFLVPPQYGLWLPPRIEHIASNDDEVMHCSLYILSEYCDGLPTEPTILILNPLIRSILWYLQEKSVIDLTSNKDKRLLQVLVDQLSEMPKVASYLPMTNHRILKPILHFLDKEPNSSLSLPDLAKQFNTTERTLIRHSKKELGMTLSEWKQRLRIIKSLSLLDTTDYTIESIAFELGYNSASAFSSVFKKLMKMSPVELRKQLRDF